ncbi:MAG: hypothetical protein COV73_01970 [Candidatus Omnitrophica bacterium CG11_big_fil_rev_8_21_14_0_20_43_6]|nr:MAG: hypothetical protein COV73_01970 [Candidatus Omnitrophica bacterium CG11_big_fil_rev_8_21_14_0_20_43_6]
MLIKRGYTLIEILVVVVIIGILASLGLPNYFKLQEKSLDREAKASLALIRAAERVYRMEIGFYYPDSGSKSVSDINTDLKLSLPTSSPKWTYSVTTPGGLATAARSGRTWTLDSSGPSEDATCSPVGSCP